MTQQEEIELRRLLLSAYRRNEYQASSCQGKSKLESYAIAKKVANNMRKRACEPPKIYRCKVCGTWHIGHASRGLRLARDRQRDKQ